VSIRENEPVITLPVNGIEVCADAFGDRTDPAVLLIGGASSSMDWWDEEFCRRLAAGGRYVIRYDHRDTGRTTSFPAGRPPYSGVDMAHDALGLLDALRVHRAHVVGISMGGILAQRIAVSRPHRVLSLTLMSTTAGPSAEPAPADAPAGVSADAPAGVSADAPAGVSADAPAGVSADAPAGVSADAPAGVLADAPAGVEVGVPADSAASASGVPADSRSSASDPSPDSAASAREEAAEMPDWNNRRFAVDRITEAVRALGGAFTPDEPQVRRFAERVFDRTNDMAACQTNHYLAEPGPPFRDGLPGIKAPTLILHGTQDPVFDHTHPETLAAEIPGARLIWLDGVGHEYPPNAVWPEVVAAILSQPS
jgi:pimeloyl-ACP methyl ester carboxylesterase